MRSRHHVVGLTGEAFACAHAKDLEVWGKQGLKYLRSCHDEASGKVIYLGKAPRKAAAEAVHCEAYGLVADEITEVRKGSEKSHAGLSHQRTERNNPMHRFHLLPRLHMLSRLMVASLGAVLLLAAFAGYTALPASAAVRHPAACTACCTWSSTDANNPGTTFGYGFYVDNPITNNNPNALVFVTYNRLGPDAGVSAWNAAPLGVYYDNWTHQWAVFNEDFSYMNIGAWFNVYKVHQLCSDAFVQTATAANSFGDRTVISSPLTDNLPNVKLLVTPNWNPGGTYNGVLDTHPLGVWYYDGHWNIIHEDGTPMQVGASYNVLASTSAVTLQATSANSTANKLLIDDPRTNNQPGVQVYVTSNLNRSYSFGRRYIYVNAILGVIDDSWDDPTTAHWTIFTEDESNIPIGATFNYFVI